jgi:Fuc2NAc and GlcNAc transferase
MMTFLFCSIIFFLSCCLTGLVRFYAVRRSMIDVPNERSSHAIPTPRGGGLAIVASFFLAILYLAYQKLISFDLTLALLGGGILVASTGWYDDCFQISARARLLTQFFAACWAVYWLHGFPLLNLGMMPIHLGWFGVPLAILAIMWMTNLYNFMDGIDGLAGMEGVFVSAAGGLFLLLSGFHSLALLNFLLASSIMGFLVWNWPPAKIFMGDVGSTTLGFIFAVFMLATANTTPISLLFWIILFAIFIFDATFTLINRIRKKESLSVAHRSHAYQQLALQKKSHFTVLYYALLINIFILFPLAYLNLLKPVFVPEIFLGIFICFLFTYWKITSRKKVCPTHSF